MSDGERVSRGQQRAPPDFLFSSILIYIKWIIIVAVDDGDSISDDYQNIVDCTLHAMLPRVGWCGYIKGDDQLCLCCYSHVRRASQQQQYIQDDIEDSLNSSDPRLPLW